MITALAKTALTVGVVVGWMLLLMWAALTMAQSAAEQTMLRTCTVTTESGEATC